MNIDLNECQNCSKMAHNFCISNMCIDCCKDKTCIVHSNEIDVVCTNCNLRDMTKGCIEFMCNVCCGNMDCDIHIGTARMVCRIGYCTNASGKKCQMCEKCCNLTSCEEHLKKCTDCNNLADKGCETCDKCCIYVNCKIHSKDHTNFIKCPCCNNFDKPKVCIELRCQLCCGNNTCGIHRKVKCHSCFRNDADNNCMEYNCNKCCNNIKCIVHAGKKENNKLCLMCFKYTASLYCSSYCCDNCCIESNCLYHNSNNLNYQKNLTVSSQEVNNLLATKCNHCKKMMANNKCIRRRCEYCCSGHLCKVHEDKIKKMCDEDRKCMYCGIMPFNASCSKFRCKNCCDGIQCFAHSKIIKCLECSNPANDSCINKMCSYCCNDSICFTHTTNKSLVPVIYQDDLEKAIEESRKDAIKQGIIVDSWKMIGTETDLEQILKESADSDLGKAIEESLKECNLNDTNNELDEFRLQMIDDIFKEDKEKIIDEDNEKTKINEEIIKKMFGKMKKMLKET